MTSHRHPRRPGANLPALLAAALVLPFFHASGQAPAAPRAETAADPAPDGSNPAPSDAAVPAPPPDRAAALAALVRKENPYALVVEPSNNGSEVFVPIPGARESGLVAARWQNGILRPYTRAEFRALDLKWKDFRARGLGIAAEHLALIDPVFDRDSRGTVELVRFISESPLGSAFLFTPHFREKLEDLLGLPFYAISPSRSVVIAFSKSGGDPKELGSLAAGLFNDAIYPASLEVFEVGKSGVRAIGIFKKD